MSTLESAFKVHHLVCYKASEKKIFLSSIPKLSSFSWDVSALFSIFSQSFFFCHYTFFLHNWGEFSTVTEVLFCKCSACLAISSAKKQAFTKATLTVTYLSACLTDFRRKFRRNKIIFPTLSERKIWIQHSVLGHQKPATFLHYNGGMQSYILNSLTFFMKKPPKQNSMLLRKPDQNLNFSIDQQISNTANYIVGHSGNRWNDKC